MAEEDELRVNPNLVETAVETQRDNQIDPVLEALDPDRGQVAAEAAEPLQQRHLRPGPRRGERRRQSARPRADDEHIGAVDDFQLARGLGDGAGGRFHRREW